jgi:hypothetical protein
MRLREQNKADLALAAVTVTVMAVTAAYEGVRWVHRVTASHLRRPGRRVTV